MDLAVDLHGKYDAYAGKIAHAVEPLNLMWLEEPAIVKITQSTTTPICAGENLYLRYGFRDLLREAGGRHHYAHISKCGGLSESRSIQRTLRRQQPARLKTIRLPTLSGLVA